MDLLSDVLSTLKLSGHIYFRTQLSSPWGIYVPAEKNVARFHVAINGGCWLGVGDDGRPFQLSEGDLALVPHGSAHRIMDHPERTCSPLDEVLDETGYDGTGLFEFGGDGSETILVCGYFEFDEDIFHPLLSSLPRSLHLNAAENPGFLSLGKVLGFIDNESEDEQLGSGAILERLSEILFIQVIRAYSERADGGIGYLAALSDPSLQRALKVLHNEPDRKWSLEELAREAGLSRSSFASRFKELVGVPAMEYLNWWRMSLAMKELKAGKKTIVEIGEEVGYSSESSFSTAFKRHFGKPPSAYRRTGEVAVSASGND